MDRCVACGRYTPEGRQVCWICERDNGASVVAKHKGSVIAKRGDNSYLVDLGEGKGYVLSPDTIGNETVMDLHAIIKFGYWEEYKDGETVQEIKQRFREEIPSD